jgi:hypothetical protein
MITGRAEMLINRDPRRVARCFHSSVPERLNRRQQALIAWMPPLVGQAWILDRGLSSESAAPQTEGNGTHLGEVGVSG